MNTDNEANTHDSKPETIDERECFSDCNYTKIEYDQIEVFRPDTKGQFFNEHYQNVQQCHSVEETSHCLNVCIEDNFEKPMEIRVSNVENQHDRRIQDPCVSNSIPFSSNVPCPDNDTLIQLTVTTNQNELIYSEPIYTITDQITNYAAETETTTSSSEHNEEVGRKYYN